MNIKDLWTDNVKLVLIAIGAAFLISGILTYKAEAQVETVEPTCELAVKVLQITEARTYELLVENEATEDEAVKAVIWQQIQALGFYHNSARKWHAKNCEPL